MTKQEKAAYSRAAGRFTYVVFSDIGNVYSSSCKLLSHAMDDAKQCGGEIWLAGRCTVPAHNVADAK